MFEHMAKKQTNRGHVVTERKCATPVCYGNAPSRNGKYCSKCKARIAKALNPYRTTYRKLKSNAKRRGKKFSLTLEEWTTWCNQTGYLGLRGSKSGDMTVDCTKAWLGYRIDNITMMTKRENVQKSKSEQLHEPVDWREIFN